MNRPTPFPSKLACLLAPMLAVGLASCGAQGGDAAFSEIALPTFSKGRVAQEAPVEVQRLLSATHRGAGWSFETSHPSPDGRYLTDIGWGLGEPGNRDGYSVIDLATGEELYLPGQNQFPSGGYGSTGSAFSPDGSRITFTFEHFTGHQVRSIGVDGSDPRVHLHYTGVHGVEPSASGEPPHFDWASVEDWSKDGRYVLVSEWLNHDLAGRRTLVRVSTIDLTTDELRGLTTPSDTYVGGAFFSPDSRFVAFDRGARNTPRDIFLAAVDGSGERALLETPDHEVLLGWLPDGSGILFYRVAEDSRAIWKLPVEDGRVAGAPELVKDDVWQMQGFGFSDEHYFYGVEPSQTRLHVASFDLEAGRMLQAPAPVVEASGPSGAWSPDGRRLAHFRDTEGFRGVTVMVRSVTGELLQEVPVDLRSAWPLHGWNARGLVVSGEDKDGRRGTYLVSPETGEASFMEHGLRGCCASEDGSKFVDGWTDGTPVIEHDLFTGAERTLLEADALALPEGEGWAGFEHIGLLIVSPDGEHVARVLGRETPRARVLEVISRSTGERRRSPSFHATTRRLRWSPDSRYCLFTANTERDGDAYLWRFSVEDGSVRRLMPIRPGRPWVRVSPDGRHVLLNYGEPRQEIWRMTFNNGG